MPEPVRYGVRLPLDDDLQVFIEAEPPLDPSRGPFRELKRGGEQTTQIAETGDRVLQTIRAFAGRCTELVAALGDDAPETFELEVGAHVDMEGNLWLVKASGGGSMTVKMTWKRGTGGDAT